MYHIIYKYKGRTYEAHKDWDIERIDRVMRRLGIDYYTLGMDLARYDEYIKEGN